MVDLCKHEVVAIKRKLHRLQHYQIKIFAVDALIELTRNLAKVYKSDIADDTSTGRLQKFAANLTDDQLRKENVPPKFWPKIRKLDRVNVLISSPYVEC